MVLRLTKQDAQLLKKWLQAMKPYQEVKVHEDAKGFKGTYLTPGGKAKFRFVCFDIKTARPCRLDIVTLNAILPNVLHQFTHQETVELNLKTKLWR